MADRCDGEWAADLASNDQARQLSEKTRIHEHNVALVGGKFRRRLRLMQGCPDHLRYGITDAIHAGSLLEEPPVRSRNTRSHDRPVMTFHNGTGPGHDDFETSSRKLIDLDCAGLPGRTTAVLAESLLGSPQRVRDLLPVQ